MADSVKYVFANIFEDQQFTLNEQFHLDLRPLPSNGLLFDLRSNQMT